MKKSVHLLFFNKKSKKSFCLELFWTVFACILLVFDLCIFLSWFRQDDFITRESNVMDRRFIFFPKQHFKVKTPQWRICFFQTCLTRHELMDWSGVDYCNVFFSCLDSYSDGTHSLQKIHWGATDVMQHLSKSVLMKKQTHLHFEWLGSEHIFS